MDEYWYDNIADLLFQMHCLALNHVRLSAPVLPGLPEPAIDTGNGDRSPGEQQ